MSYPKSRLGKLFIKKSDLLRELDAVLNAVEADLVTTSGDGSIVNTNGDVRVGVLATDAQHGNRGGGALHATATTGVPGFLSAVDKTKLDTVASTTNWTVTDWYIDGVVGLDSNDGVTALTPLQTGAELLRRLGPYAIWPQSVTVHVLANGMVDALVLRGLMQVAGEHLAIIGTPTQLATDTVATYTGQNHAAATAPQLTGGIADWTPYQWRRCRITSGVRQGTLWWIAAPNPAGAGLNVARIVRPSNIDVASVTDDYVNIVPVPGDAFAIEALPSLPTLDLQIDGPILQTAGPQYSRRQFEIANLSISSLTVRATAVTERSKAVIFGCRIQNWNLGVPQLTGISITKFQACSITVGDPAIGNFHRQWGQFFNCLFGESNPSFSFTGSSFVTDSIFQACAATASVFLTWTNSQVFDVAGATSVAFSPAIGGASNGLSGSGNAGFGIVIGNNTTFRFLGTTNLIAAVSNARLSAAPAISLTIPDLLQPSDYAKKGTTAAMIAGTTTVTVPWYDNATQRVTVSHAVFGGTPGILSVQQISTTQFTITSSSALDTSTVNWTISPLGRNIFISIV